MVAYAASVSAAAERRGAQAQPKRLPQPRAVLLVDFQRSLGNRATVALVSRLSIQRKAAGAADPRTDDPKRFLVRYLVGTGNERRRDIDGIAAGLKERLRGQQYGLVRAVIN